MTTHTNKDTTVLCILNTVRELNQLQDMDMILDSTLYEARQLSNADAGSIFLLRDKELQFSHVQNDTLFGKKGAGAAQYTSQSIPISEDSIVGYSALTKEVVVIDDAYNIDPALPYSFNSSFDETAHYRTTSILTLPLLTLDGSLVGVMQLINARDNDGKVTVFSEHNKTHVPIFSDNAAVIIERSILNRELVLRMAKMAELRDPKETGSHVLRVSAYSAEIYERWARKREIPSAEIRHCRDIISLAAILHDAGKVGIPDAVLKKPARLTMEEFEVIKQHTIFGAKLFTNISSEVDQVTYDIALHHHEKWNGKGYPGKVDDDLDAPGLPMTGEETPLAARVTGLADVFDALCSRRCYKDSWDLDRVYEEIRKESGESFDPELVDAFFEITDILEAIQQKFQ